MKTGALLLLLLCLCRPSFSQSNTQTTVSGSITKKALLQFKTIEEALALPPTYKIVQYQCRFSRKGEISLTGGIAGMFPPIISNFISRASKGDVIMLDNIIVKKGDREIKLIGKSWVVK